MSDTENLKNKYKFNYPLRVWVFFGFIEGVLLASLLYAIYEKMQGISVDAYYFENLIMGILMFAFVFLTPVTLVPLFLVLREKMQIEKSIFKPDVYVFPQNKTPDLEYILHYMKAYNTGIAWKTVAYISLFLPFTALILFIEEIIKRGEFPHDKIEAMIYYILMAMIPFVIEKVLRIRWLKRPRAEELLHNTKKFIEITDDEGFLKLLQKDLNEGILYYTKDVVLTENYILCKTLGLWDWFQSFNWANDLLVIPRVMIEKMNTNIEVTKVSHYAASAHVAMHAHAVTGEWKCELLNGKKVSFWVTGGFFVAARFKRLLQAFLYYGLPVIHKESK